MRSPRPCGLAMPALVAVTLPLMLRAFTEFEPQEVEGVNAGIVTVGPDESKRVGTDAAHAHRADVRRNVLLGRPLGMIPELSLAARAGAVEAERQPGVAGLVAIRPCNRKRLVCDATDLHRSRHFRAQRSNPPNAGSGIRDQGSETTLSTLPTR